MNETSRISVCFCNKIAYRTKEEENDVSNVFNKINEFI